MPNSQIFSKEPVSGSTIFLAVHTKNTQLNLIWTVNHGEFLNIYDSKSSQNENKIEMIILRNFYEIIKKQKSFKPK